MLGGERETFTFIAKKTVDEVSGERKHKTATGSAQFSSVAQSCPTLCDPMYRSTPGLPVHHQLPEFTQTHVHRVSDAIQPRVTAIKLSIFLCLNLTVSLFLRVHRMIITGIIFRYSHHPSEWNLLGSCVAKCDPEL